MNFITLSVFKCCHLLRQQHETFPSFTRTSPEITTISESARRVDPMECRHDQHMQNHNKDLLYIYHDKRLAEEVEMLVSFTTFIELSWSVASGPKITNGTTVLQ